MTSESINENIVEIPLSPKLTVINMIERPALLYNCMILVLKLLKILGYYVWSSAENQEASVGLSLIACFACCLAPKSCGASFLLLHSLIGWMDCILSYTPTKSVSTQLPLNEKSHDYPALQLSTTTTSNYPEYSSSCFDTCSHDCTSITIS